MRRQGGSESVTIPKSIVQELEIKLGDKLLVDVEGSKIVYEKSSKKVKPEAKR